MAYIGHRCGCGHSDLQHSDSDTCQANAGTSCGRGCTPDPESQILPSFDAKGTRIERVLPPGDSFKSVGGVSIVTTCTCDACQTLHQQLASV